MIPTSQQEYFGWIGNGIFFSAQLSQIIYTYRIKSAEDLSYVLFFFWFIGEIMYTTFGYIDNSPSMFYGNGMSLLLSIFQIGQKIHYKRIKNGINNNGINNGINNNRTEQELLLE